VLARMFPSSRIVGVDMSEPSLIVARARAEYYGYRQVEFYLSQEASQLPELNRHFDCILMIAVFEHLLPLERQSLLTQLWKSLLPGGILFLNQTPWRYFPFEGHTTRLPILNYLPDSLTLTLARYFSHRVNRHADWKSLLRAGIRGGSVHEILRILGQSNQNQPLLLKPCRCGCKDRIDVWYAGYAPVIARKYPRVKKIQTGLKHFFKVVKVLTSATITPSLSLAIRKQVV